MRAAGVCTNQHALTVEAASIVKQAVSLARRRGHSQVTPLHVASAMLNAPSGSLLQAACRRLSHSHPLHCKALELCFNVALNRLPTSSTSSGPLFGGPHFSNHHHQQHHHPTYSNALVAAFKRAQAQQRRGSAESQQQPILALRIELQLLVVSILDDPSVSRVMREAGFNSSLVKVNVEQAVSLEVGTKNVCPPLGKGSDQVCSSDDVRSVLDTMMSRKRKNTVIVGESLASAEGLIKRVMDKFEKGEVPTDLRLVQFISLPLCSLHNLSEDAVDQKLVELKLLVRSCLGRGVVLYLGDLKWVSEFWSSNYGGAPEERKSSHYCPVEHTVMELRRLACGPGGPKIWIMGIAGFKTYMRCKMGMATGRGTGRPPLESIWELHPLAIPAGSLDLSLNLDSNFKTQTGSKIVLENGGQTVASRGDSVFNFETEAKSKLSTTCTSTGLPLWLQQCREERRSLTAANQEVVAEVSDSRKKWNTICSSVNIPNSPVKTALTLFSSSSSPSSISTSSLPNSRRTILGWPVIFETSFRSPKEHQFWPADVTNGPQKPPDLLSNPNSSPNSASSSEALLEEHQDHCLDGLMETTPDNLKVLCDALEKKVPWHKDIIPQVLSTILDCRSGGLVRRKAHLKPREGKQETWLLFLGLETEGKERIAREIARVIFGSYSNYVSISLSSFSSTTLADSTEVTLGNKRVRDELGRSYLQRFFEAVVDNPHRVFYVEDVEQADPRSQTGIVRAMESGKIQTPDGRYVALEDAIIIFSCESLSSVSRAGSPFPTKKQKYSEETDKEKEKEKEDADASLDLNAVAVEPEDGDENPDGVADMEILESVDGQFVFKTEEL